MKEPDHFGETLPQSGVQLTVHELREMACRQQAQIDSQHQLLAAKEQRLRYLKEQEARQQRVHAESERLRRLRDRVDAQELKLRKLRALRGQVDHQKQNNVSLTSDLDSIRALFNEKEKELSLAVAKVEELTRQLEELRRGRNSRDQPPPSALELDKLRRELMYRNKLNEQQNQRLNQQREALTARQEEMSAIDKRISELQDRLHRKRLLNQQLANQISATSHKAAYHQLVRLTGNAEQNNIAFRKQQTSSHPPNGLSRGNIAAVEPYNHVPLQSSHSARGTNNLQENPTYHSVYQQNHHIKKESESNQHGNSQESQEIINKMTNLYMPKHEDSDNLKEFTVSKSDPKYQTLPYNTKFSVNLLPNRVHRTDSVDSATMKNEMKQEETNNTNSPTTNGALNMQTPHMTVHSAPLTVINKNIATPLNQNDLISRKNSNEHKEQINGSIPNGGFQHINKPLESTPFSGTSTTGSSNGISYQKPISSVAPTSIHHTGVISNIYQTSSIKVQSVEPQTVCSTNQQLPTPLYTSQIPPIQQSPQLAALSPPQATSSPLSTPEVSLDKAPKPALPPKPAIKPPPRLTQAPSEDTVPPPPLPQTDPPEPPRSAKFGKSFLPQPIGNATEMIIKAKPLTIKKGPLSEQPKLRNVNSHAKMNGYLSSSNSRRSEPSTSNVNFSDCVPQLNQSTDSQSGSDKNEMEKEVKSVDEVDKGSIIDEVEVIGRELVKDEKPIDSVIRRCKKGNLKQTGKTNLSRRVSFDPLALLLDASLEGELELVQRTATQVANPSAANDEGITALHNAICAGHLEIVQFLVEFGCDVNAQDSDGWTPLHCAASCNNVSMVRFLVERGACIFATTLSDHETAAEKCEEDEEGFDGCSEYLYSVQEKLGILSNGEVYAVFDYTAQQPDELSFKAGQQLTVLRKGDENEREWWWSRLGDKEGYVPRNLLGLYPRVTRNDD